MKLCFPIKENSGIKSIVHNHFGSADSFLLYDTETEQVDIINNQDRHHSHGMCNPLKALDGSEVNAVVVAAIGAGALAKLNAMGIKVYKSQAPTVAESVALIKDGTYMELDVQNACAHHGPCSH